MSSTTTTLEQRLDNLRDLESRLTFRLAVISKQLDKDAQDLLTDQPVNLTGYRVLNIIGTLGDLSISDIGRYTELDRAQISRTAVELSSAGLVTFVHDLRSKRKKIVHLTADGHALLKRMRPIFRDRQLRLREALGQDIYDGLLAGLGRLSEVLAR
ncbi:MAG: MarR family transcriptional regulator [Pseudomonadota bacterium]